MPGDIEQRKSFEISQCGKLSLFLKNTAKAFLERKGQDPGANDTVVRIIDSVLAYNRGLEQWVNGASFLANDVSRLCEAEGCKIDDQFSRALQEIASFLSKDAFSGFASNSIPKSLHDATMRVLDEAKLTKASYAILNNYLLRRNEHDDITSYMNSETKPLNDYAVIREIRVLLPFFIILYVNRNSPERSPAITGIAMALRRLFKKDVVDTPLHAKIVLASNLYRMETEFQQGLDMFEVQSNAFKRILADHGIASGSPILKAFEELSGADKRSGLETVGSLLRQLASKGIIEADRSFEMMSTFEIGVNLLQKALGAYRGVLNDQSQRRMIDDDFLETIFLKIAGGSDFTDTTSLAQDIAKGYRYGEYPERLLGIALNVLLSLQVEFVTYDNYGPSYAKLEKTTQNRELSLAREIKEILSSIAAGSRNPPNLALTQTLLFYLRFLLSLIYKPKNRQHILDSQLDFLRDSPSTPYDFTFFRRSKSSSAESAPSFEPIPKGFESLAAQYGIRAADLAHLADPQANPNLVAQLRAWLFSQNQ